MDIGILYREVAMRFGKQFLQQGGFAGLPRPRHQNRRKGFDGAPNRAFD
jgi:hypothetical protein